MTAESIHKHADAFVAVRIQNIFREARSVIIINMSDSAAGSLFAKCGGINGEVAAF